MKTRQLVGKQITVYGHKGIAAKAFANGNDNVTFKEVSISQKGDVDLNRKVNIQDCTALQRYLAEMIQLDSQAMRLADIDGDNKITIADVTELQCILAESE